MKKAITLILLATTILLSFSGFKSETTYTKKALVTEVIRPCKEHPHGLVTITDRNGEMWDFEFSDDWIEGDFIEAQMSDNGTVNYIYDDYFLTDEDGYIIAAYNGHISQIIKEKCNIYDFF